MINAINSGVRTHNGNPEGAEFLNKRAARSPSRSDATASSAKSKARRR
jgi:hypothetical protein